jgi:hypothetical protein
VSARADDRDRDGVWSRADHLGFAPPGWSELLELATTLAGGGRDAATIDAHVAELRRTDPIAALLRRELAAIVETPGTEAPRVERGAVVLLDGPHVRAVVRRREPPGAHEAAAQLGDVATTLFVPITTNAWTVSTRRTAARVTVDRFTPGLALGPPELVEDPPWHLAALADEPGAPSTRLAVTTIAVARPGWFLELSRRPTLPYAWRFEQGRAVALAHADLRTSRLALVLDWLRRAALPAAEPAFRALLDDPHFDLRWKSMQGLARLGTPDVDRRLEALARDPHPEVAETARRASAGRRPG